MHAITIAHAAQPRVHRGVKKKQSNTSRDRLRGNTTEHNQHRPSSPGSDPPAGDILVCAECLPEMPTGSSSQNAVVRSAWAALVLVPCVLVVVTELQFLSKERAHTTHAGCRQEHGQADASFWGSWVPKCGLS